MNRREQQIHQSIAKYLGLAPAFWSHVDSSAGPDACWPWTGARRPTGYGIVKRPGTRQNTSAHRLAYEIANGSPPLARKFVVRHGCDNPPCCNPDHLTIGYQADNYADAVERGRTSPPPRHSGEAHPRAKLTLKRVVWARALNGQGMTCAELARAFGVGETTLGHALAGRTWRHEQT